MTISRSIASLAALTAAFASGCADIRIPAATISQVMHPEWTWAESPPRDRVRGGVVMKFPECNFSTPEEEEEFRDLIRAVNNAGREQPTLLERGEITHQQYVINILILEVVAGFLAEACENDPTVEGRRDSTYQQVLSAAGVQLDIEAMANTRGTNRLDAARRALGQLHR